MAATRNEQELRDFCARVLREPERVAFVSYYQVIDRKEFYQHKHDQAIQFDLAVGCGGTWPSPAGARAVRGTTAAVFYPGIVHGYAITSRSPAACMYTVKIDVELSWLAVKKRVFPELAHDVAGEAPLVQAWRRMHRMYNFKRRPETLLAAVLAEVLSLWPTKRGESAPGPAQHAAALDERMEAALELIEARATEPPDLETMAAAAHLSPRHFTRRFRELLGCSPLEYVSAQRLARAKDLLGQGTHGVAQVAAALGFSSIYAFSRWFRRETGSAPSSFRHRVQDH